MSKLAWFLLCILIYQGFAVDKLNVLFFIALNFTIVNGLLGIILMINVAKGQSSGMTGTALASHKMKPNIRER